MTRRLVAPTIATGTFVITPGAASSADGTLFDITAYIPRIPNSARNRVFIGVMNGDSGASDIGKLGPSVAVKNGEDGNLAVTLRCATKPTAMFRVNYLVCY